jgi:alpha-galactosidase
MTPLSDQLIARILVAVPRAVLGGSPAGLAASQVRVHGSWEQGRARFVLVNEGVSSVFVDEVIVADIDHELAATTAVFGEGFQKLSMTGGTLAEPVDLGAYSDRDHYRIPEPEGIRTAYGVLSLAPEEDDRILIAATSCERFIARFSFSSTRLRISFDCEGIELRSGESWNLEELLLTAGADRGALFSRLTDAIAEHHPRLEHEVPAGWSSWLCFGPDVRSDDVAANAGWIAERSPSLKYVQIDDGYQPWMGDWLEVGDAFDGDVEPVLEQIRSEGLVPSMWLAPFIASPQSRLLREHPDWFVAGDDDEPLDSSTVGFGGWRQGPWFVLDGTHPGAQDYLTRVFRTMREEWGVGFFKLDAAYWGAIHGGRLHDPHATRIEAYRQGMMAIRRGAGSAFLLGCNHPVWPSLGLIHGSRSSNDVLPTWNSFHAVSLENNHRIWQNGRLWWNDPDTLVLSGRFAESLMGPDGLRREAEALTDDELHYHVASTYAVGGLILSSDDLPSLPPERADLLARVAHPTGVSIRFTDDRFETGEIRLPSGPIFAIFNRSDEPAVRSIRLPDRPTRLTDYLTDEDLGVHISEYTEPSFPPHFGRLITAQPISP